MAEMGKLTDYSRKSEHSREPVFRARRVYQAGGEGY